MPVTEIDFPILQHFFCAVESSTGMPVQPLDAPGAEAIDNHDVKKRNDEVDNRSKTLPKGVVLGPDGKPCRSCTSVSSWMAMARGESARQDEQQSTSSSFSASSTIPQQQQQQPQRADCPADVEQLGRSTWTFLHTLTANYPERPSTTHQADTKQFLGLFGRLYPCWVCAEDFRAWMRVAGNEPRVSSREEFGRWMCEAHNAVNEKLGKDSFDCGKWQERWRTGWKDGSCD